MYNLEPLFQNAGVVHEVLPPDHPLMRGQPINMPIYDQDHQWRLKIQAFSRGGFEAKVVLVNRNALNRLVNANQLRGKRAKPKEKDEATKKRDLEKCAYRAATKVRQLCFEISADRLLTLTSRQLLTDYDQVVATWKRFMRLLESAGEKFEYVAVPELHKNGEHYHIHAAINGFTRVELIRRCWQIALGGKGDERGPQALGNVDIKHSKRKNQDYVRHATGIAKYISKYIVKSYKEHHLFNRKRYWYPRSIKLPASLGEWLQAQTLREALLELHTRFDGALMMEAGKYGILITEANVPMIFFRFIPDPNNPLPAPF